MQLFLTNVQLNGNILSINEDRVVHQLKNVLRSAPGYTFQVQSCELKQILTVQLETISKDLVTAKIIDKKDLPIKTKNIKIVVGMLNKFDKMELIVQKLAEIGVSEIVFTVMERSIIREISTNKLARLNLIALEAVEQSKGVLLPKISFVEKFTNIFVDSSYKYVFFDMDGKINYKDELANLVNLSGIVGPEGGFGPKDYTILDNNLCVKIGLGNTVLRAETAAIVGSFILENL